MTYYAEEPDTTSSTAVKATIPTSMIVVMAPI